jgi:hypothetical protein
MVSRGLPESCGAKMREIMSRFFERKAGGETAGEA